MIAITVTVGALSGVDAEALSFAFPLAAEGTAAQGARLASSLCEAQVHCRSCGAEAGGEFPFAFCQACGSSDVEIAAGRELDIKSVEI